jgi:hypothetical protein
MYRALMFSRENIWEAKIDKINRKQNEKSFSSGISFVTKQTKPRRRTSHD